MKKVLLSAVMCTLSFEMTEGMLERYNPNSGAIVRRDIAGSAEGLQYEYLKQIQESAESLQREYLKQIQEMEKQFQEELQREREAHAQEMAAGREKLSEAEKAKAQLEREKILRGLLLHINVEDKTPIRITADDIMQLDVLERHVKTDEIYQRFLPYSELFGRADLGVLVTQEDLFAVFNYINITRVSPEPAPLILIRDPHKGPKNWNTYVSCADMWFLIKKYRMLEIAWNCPSGTDYGEVHTSAAYGNESSNLERFNYYKNLENAERQRVYNDALAKRDAELRLAQEALFPSREFNCLVEQVNSFLSEGLEYTLVLQKNV